MNALWKCGTSKSGVFSHSCVRVWFWNGFARGWKILLNFLIDSTSAVKPAFANQEVISSKLFMLVRVLVGPRNIRRQTWINPVLDMTTPQYAQCPQIHTKGQIIVNNPQSRAPKANSSRNLVNMQHSIQTITQAQDWPGDTIHCFTVPFPSLYFWPMTTKVWCAFPLSTYHPKWTPDHSFSVPQIENLWLEISFTWPNVPHSAPDKNTSVKMLVDKKRTVLLSLWQSKSQNLPSPEESFKIWLLLYHYSKSRCVWLRMGWIQPGLKKYMLTSLAFQHSIDHDAALVPSPSPQTAYPKLPQRKRNNNIWVKEHKWLFTLAFLWGRAGCCLAECGHLNSPCCSATLYRLWWRRSEDLNCKGKITFP